MDTVDILDGEVETRTRNFISKGKELHQEIFIEHRLRLNGTEELPLNIESVFYEYLSAASVHNRNMEMSFIYAIAHEEKKRMETLKTIIATAALPVQISARPAIAALQTGLGLIAYLISVSDKLKLDENLKKYRGPVVISEVYYKKFNNICYGRNPNNLNEEEWGRNEIDKDLSYVIKNAFLKENKLKEFIQLEIPLLNEIKYMK